MFCPRCFRKLDDGAFCPFDGEKLLDKPDIARLRWRCKEPAKGFVGEKFLLRGKLGQSSMSEVYLAEERYTGEPVAIKMLRKKRIRDPRAKARFILEANAALRVEHPNTIRVMEVGVTATGSPYIVMEFLLGESLSELLERKGMLKPADALAITADVARGLGAAHAAGIIHRDIKPGNIFLVGELGTHHLTKVVDFGMAKLAEKGGLTQAGTAVGTIEYMAPEQTVNDPVDARTDVYGLGVTLFRMLTGKVPFEAEHEDQLLALHLFAEAPSVSSRNRNINPMLCEMVRRMLAKSPANRYESMDAILEALAPYTQGPRSVRGGSLPDRSELVDQYEPQLAFGQQAAAFLRKRFEELRSPFRRDS